MSTNGIPWGVAVPGMGRSIYAGFNSQVLIELIAFSAKTAPATTGAFRILASEV
jgi:hypothetical protein